MLWLEFFEMLEGKPAVAYPLLPNICPRPSSHYARQVARMRPSGQRREGWRGAASSDMSISLPAMQAFRADGTENAVQALLTDRPIHTDMARPSVNHVQGMAQSYGAGALWHRPFGIGRDGTAGGREVIKAGGALIARIKRAHHMGYAVFGGACWHYLRHKPPSEMPRYLREHCGWRHEGSRLTPSMRFLADLLHTHAGQIPPKATVARIEAALGPVLRAHGLFA